MAASSSDTVGEVQGTCSVETSHSLEETWHIGRFIQRIESGVSVLKSPVFASASLPLVKWQIRFDLKDAKETGGLNLLVVLKDNGDLPTPVSGELTVQLIPAPIVNSSSSLLSVSGAAIGPHSHSVSLDSSSSIHKPSASPSAARLTENERRRYRRVALSLPSVNTAQAFWQYVSVKDLPEMVDRNDDGSLRIKVHIGLKTRADEARLTEFQRPTAALLEPSSYLDGLLLASPGGSVANAFSNDVDGANGKYSSTFGMVNAPLFTDVDIVVGGEIVVRAHRLILALNSPVFRTMLEGGRFTEGRTQRVSIGDAAPDAVRALVRFLYAGAIDDRTLARDEAALALLELADRFQVTALRRRCVAWLMSHLSVQNVLAALARADLHANCDELKRACVTFVARNAMAVINVNEQSGWREFVVKHPGLVTELFAALSTQSTSNAAASATSNNGNSACSCSGKRRRTDWNRD